MATTYELVDLCSAEINAAYEVTEERPVETKEDDAYSSVAFNIGTDRFVLMVVKA